MGLTVSHDGFSGAYSAFNRFRQIVAKAWGGSYPPHEDKVKCSDHEFWYAPPGVTIEDFPGLYAFMTSNDCCGSFMPPMAKKIADEMEKLLPEIERLSALDSGGGHIERNGGYVAVTKRYIAACRLAHRKRQRLTYR